MKQEDTARWLKGASVGAALLGVPVFWFWTQCLLDPGLSVLPGTGLVRWLAALLVWLIGGACYLSILQFWGVCGRIGEDRSFCEENVRAMAVIARCLGVAAVLSLMHAVLTCVPGIFPADGAISALRWLSVLLACVFGGVALLARALSLLLRKAVVLQADHDLTV